MVTLVINSGSSSIKYKVFDLKGSPLDKGVIGRIGFKSASSPANHAAAIRMILEKLTGRHGGSLKNVSQIKAVGHRVVHGGEKFKEPTLINMKVLAQVEKFSSLAPLHNPPNIQGIKACMKFLPGIPQVAVFDTAYYQTLPEAHYLYAIPQKLYNWYGIRKYGFHGTSHKYVALKTVASIKKDIHKSKIITCHLGNGCSVTATAGGRAVDTSMGFTPLEGLIMGTRCGDIDPAVILYLMQKEMMSRAQVDQLLNNKSGLLGISGLSSDMRDIYRALEHNKRAKLAFDMFVHRIHKYIGAFVAVMDGVDAITFTGGIGENHPPTRKAVLSNLKYLGIELNDRKNKKSEKVISKSRSKVKALVIPTDEEWMIANQTMGVIKKL